MFLNKNMIYKIKLNIYLCNINIFILFKLKFIILYITLYLFEIKLITYKNTKIHIYIYVKN